MLTSGSSRSRRAVVCDAVEPGRHAHVDEQRVRTAGRPHARGLHLLDSFFALIRGIELEASRPDRLHGRAAEELLVERVQLAAIRRAAAENLAKVLVDRAIVVDDQDPPIRLDRAA